MNAHLNMKKAERCHLQPMVLFFLFLSVSGKNESVLLPFLFYISSSLTMEMKEKEQKTEREVSQGRADGGIGVTPGLVFNFR